jgi:hypothetical protein
MISIKTSRVHQGRYLTLSAEFMASPSGTSSSRENLSVPACPRRYASYAEGLKDRTLEVRDTGRGARCFRNTGANWRRLQPDMVAPSAARYLALRTL